MLVTGCGLFNPSETTEIFGVWASRSICYSTSLTICPDVKEQTCCLWGLPKLNSVTFLISSLLLEPAPASPFLEEEAHVSPLAWIDSLRKAKICLPFDFRKCKIRLLFSIVGFLRITAEVTPLYTWRPKGEKQKKNTLYVWKARLGLYFCHHPFVDTELFQMSPQATWYKGDFGQERQSLYFMWHPDSSQGHESYFPNYWWNLWEAGQCSSCKGGGTSQASLLITPMFQVLTELVPTEGGKKWPQQQMLMKHLLGWAAGETKQQSLSGCVSKDLMEEGIPGAGAGGLQAEAYLRGCLGDQQASKLQ